MVDEVPRIEEVCLEYALKDWRENNIERVGNKWDSCWRSASGNLLGNLLGDTEKASGGRIRVLTRLSTF